MRQHNPEALSTEALTLEEIYLSSSRGVHYMGVALLPPQQSRPVLPTRTDSDQQK